MRSLVKYNAKSNEVMRSQMKYDAKQNLIFLPQDDERIRIVWTDDEQK